MIEFLSKKLVYSESSLSSSSFIKKTATKIEKIVIGEQTPNQLKGFLVLAGSILIGLNTKQPTGSLIKSLQCLASSFCLCTHLAHWFTLIILTLIECLPQLYLQRIIKLSFI